MTSKNSPKFSVITGNDIGLPTEHQHINNQNTDYHSNPMYQKLLNFRNLQEQQKKKFSVDDLFKLC